MDQKQYDKLPYYAKRVINDLRSRISDLESKFATALNEGRNSGSGMFLKSVCLEAEEIPIENGFKLFIPTSNASYEIYKERDMILVRQVSGSIGAMVVIPQAANTVYVDTRER
ncbi:hypothetical protein [uncultured Roseibium sp.]|uniref:DUF7239 family protein n=1 Tax=uncultured Roseibium sp. TaxID=1936171 RepID=UPI00262D96F9|nr:hypothetical protein [uncultured Roseibium sp.]